MNKEQYEKLINMRKEITTNPCKYCPKILKGILNGCNSFCYFQGELCEVSSGKPIGAKIRQQYLEAPAGIGEDVFISYKDHVGEY